MRLWTKVLVLSMLLLKYCSKSQEASADTKGESNDEERIYWLRKCSGPGCPYTASYLAHINLYRQLGWKTDSTKMETHSFVIFDYARQKYQLDDHDAYYVHHMSHFEHLVQRESGFAKAEELSGILGQAAYEGECQKLDPSKFNKGYLGLVPFYSGLPPNVTSNLHVKSIGQVRKQARRDSLTDLPILTHDHSPTGQLPCQGGDQTRLAYGDRLLGPQVLW